jgi:uncharacterized protein (DUF169 family)
LEQWTGSSWIGIRLNGEVDSTRLVSHPLRICEAVRLAKTNHFILPAQMVDCLGGLRSIGHLDVDTELAEHVMQSTGWPLSVVRPILQKASRCAGIRTLEFGCGDEADCWVSYARPAEAMRLVRLSQRYEADEIAVQVSTFMATCANVMCRAVLTHRLCLSLGCPVSREKGFIQPDEMVIGVSHQWLDTRISN